MEEQKKFDTYKNRRQKLRDIDEKLVYSYVEVFPELLEEYIHERKTLKSELQAKTKIPGRTLTRIMHRDINDAILRIAMALEEDEMEFFKKWQEKAHKMRKLK